MATIDANLWRTPLSYDLAEMSLKDLKKLERDVAAAINGYDSRTKGAAIAELEAHARQLGFSLAELTGTEISVKRHRSPAAAKYRNPENHSDTWSGRGRKPRWFEAALAAGTKVSDLMV
jgi:DNA-binding protein H-NS